MKKNSLIILGLIFISSVAFLSPNMSSSIAHIDTEYILEKIPAYQDAQAELEQLAKQYQDELIGKKREIDSLWSIYQKEEYNWVKETKKLKEEEIINLEQESRDLQKKYFGREGELAQKREELIKPIQDNIYTYVVEIAEEGDYDYIFDKVTGEILYAREKNDESDAILKKLGY